MDGENQVKKVYKEPDPASLIVTKWLLWLYLLAFCVIYPFYYEDHYYNMGDAKWHFFKAITFFWDRGDYILPGLLMLVLACAVWYLITLGVRGELREKIRFSVTDGFVLAYLIVVTVSALTASDKSTVLWGFNGWYMGYMAQLSFVLIYFLVSRFFDESGSIIVLALAAAEITFLLAVLNRFKIDPLGIYDGNIDGTHYFVSTFGNTTWYGCYLTVMLAIAVYYFWDAKKLWIKIGAGIVTATGFMTAVTTDSDAVFVGLFGILSALFFFSCKDTRHFRNFWFVLLTGLASFKCIGVLRKLFPGRSVWLHEIPLFLSEGNLMWGFLLLTAAVCLLVCALERRGKLNLKVTGVLRRVYLALVFAGIALLVVYIALNSNGLLPEGLRSDSNYLLWNDRWGDNRGGIWSVSVLSFFRTIKDDFKTFLFGAGPDNFRVTTYHYFNDRLRQIAYNATDPHNANAVLTCAHNEWLCAFLNYGLLGGVAYLGIFVSAIRRFSARIRRFPMVTAGVLAVVSYFAFDFFCYQQIISTPLIFIVLGAAEYTITRSQRGLQKESPEGA